MRAAVLLLLASCGARAPTAPQTLVLFVMDTVRADHTSLCGYSRPTTPFLAGLPADGWAHTCGMVTPAPWTLPSHASYFTGLDVATHGARFRDEGVSLRDNIHVRPLDPSFDTLAEQLQRQGWQTVLVSANPILTDASGLTQGFDVVRTAGEDGARGFRGDGFADELRAALRGLDDSRPLLLVVNLFDAHDPYPAVPQRHPYLEPGPRLPLQVRDEASPYVRFHHGTLPADEAGPWLGHVTDGYDRGVELVDRNLAAAWAVLQDGWLDQGWRVVITSDHGELLGEHDRLRHGGHLWEPLLRVPLLYRDSTGPSPDLSGTVAGVEVFSLLRDGRRPDVRPPALSYAEPTSAHPSPGIWGVSLIDGDEKLWWTEGQEPTRFALRADPGELAPASLGADPRRASLEAAAAAGLVGRDAPAAAGVDAAALRALGYVK